MRNSADTNRTGVSFTATGGSRSSGAVLPLFLKVTEIRRRKR